jgi:hypothetical protein
MVRDATKARRIGSERSAMPGACPFGNSKSLYRTIRGVCSGPGALPGLARSHQARSPGATSEHCCPGPSEIALVS